MTNPITVTKFLENGNQPNTLVGHIAQFTRHGRIKSARIESIEGDTITLRYNGVNEFDWYHPIKLSCSDVLLWIGQNGMPPLYDARPLTQR